jgi:hypothetical protein
LCQQCEYAEEFKSRGFAAGGVNAHQKETGHSNILVKSKFEVMEGWNAGRADPRVYCKGR